jgi:beta-lactamase class A
VNDQARPRGHAAPRAVVVFAVAVTLSAPAACAGADSGSHTTLPRATVSQVVGSATAAATPTGSSGVSQPATRSRPGPVAATPNTAQARAQVAQRTATLIAGQPKGGVSLAALNTVTGAGYSAGATSGMWTASVYKLFVLETLLLQHQQAGTTLSGDEVGRATPMIENSDNAAGYDLFLAVGGRSGLASAAKRLGMTRTVPGRSDPTFTTTSAQDFLVLLRNLATSGPLDARSRSFALGLMRAVEADQRWGVGVLADRGTTFANKNGWLAVDDTNGPGEDDDDRWVVNSVGIVTVNGQQVLLSIFTQHQDSFADGIDLVQALAKAVEPAVA